MKGHRAQALYAILLLILWIQEVCKIKRVLTIPTLGKCFIARVVQTYTSFWEKKNWGKIWRTREAHSGRVLTLLPHLVCEARRDDSTFSFSHLYPINPSWLPWAYQGSTPPRSHRSSPSTLNKALPETPGCYLEKDLAHFSSVELRLQVSNPFSVRKLTKGGLGYGVII